MSKMNIYAKTIGGGVFSKVMISLQNIHNHFIQNKIDLNSINNIYIEIDKDRVDKNKQIITDYNPLDFVLDQNKELIYDIILKCKIVQGYSNLENNIDLNRLKIIGKKLKIKDIIINRINPNITENTLGVHVRLTDMNVSHAKNFGIADINMYIAKIKYILNNNKNINNIFVASDNIESINKLKLEFKDMIISNSVSNRSENENDINLDYQKFLRQNSNSSNLWQDSFLEAISLANCNYMLKRVSNVNNAAMILSKNEQKIYNL